MAWKGLTVLALAVLVGCSTQRQPATPPVQTPPGAEVPAPAPAPQEQAEAVERLRGPYSTATGWSLCGQSAAQALRVTGEARAALEPFVAQHPQFFLDGWGRRTADGVDLISVERMHTEGPGCDEPLHSFVWVAHGEEPFWAFGITNSGMRFKAAGEQARVYPYVAPQEGPAEVVYAGQAFRLTLRQQACASGMADARYAWSAEFESEGRSWRGCAWQGLQVEQGAGQPAS